ncbi:MAG: cytochrome-c peroxidase [Bdellovibrionales bacterium]|jgi:cytochrome c peroxidase|nr:cytochrome-c peroxidase [Bdellovibrionales bacterium]MBT3526447.1 cytochrome-c peroxidase [Bdellovibrionales bacterium]MBT7668739.1 cytochrome-c peroxidase [Bdellovibrionales bacterium]MBT7766231.1 cytochrome-c peroxidase [Bdellovibrionales bacterium]
MSIRRSILIFIVSLLSASTFADNFLQEPIQLLVPATDLDQRKVILGDRLFHETKLSGDNTISCASCHSLATGGVDRLPFAKGIKGQVGNINTPTVFNSGKNFVQFWNGRAQNLEEQAAGPVHNPGEMGSNWLDVITKLEKDSAYLKQFKEIYNSGPTGEAIVDAIATFERSLVTLNSPFDQYLKGDKDAISPKAKKGYQHFKSLGCAACHQGQGVGGNLFQIFGVAKSLKDSKIKNPNDLGRYLHTNNEFDRYLFKVPMLRNVAVTAPYFHSGQVQTLEGAIRVMAEFQLGRQISDEEVEDIAAFLRSLTGEYKGERLK